MPKPRGGLGRGLGSLIPETPTGEDLPQTDSAPGSHVPQAGGTGDAGTTGLLQVPVNSVSPNPRQPRQVMNENELDELAGSIREHGMLQPLVVTYDGGAYKLIAGERRWRAARLAGLEMVPVVVKEASSREMLELALVENLQRADLNPLEQATAYRSLVDEFGLKQEEVAARVGKSRQAVANTLRLLRLPQPVQEALLQDLIGEGHARAILQAPNAEYQIRLMQRVVADGLSVRQTEELARRLAEAAEQAEEQVPAGKEPTPLYDEVKVLEESFREALGTKVQLSRSSRGGKLVIYFFNDEELQRIYDAIVGEET